MTVALIRWLFARAFRPRVGMRLLLDKNRSARMLARLPDNIRRDIGLTSASSGADILLAPRSIKNIDAIVKKHSFD